MNRLFIACLLWVAALLATACSPINTTPSIPIGSSPIPPSSMTSTPLPPTAIPAALPRHIPLPLEIQVLECPKSLALGPTANYRIAFQVLQNGQPAQADIVVNFLVDDIALEVKPREVTTGEQGRVMTKVFPNWQDQQQQTVTVGAMILPQRIGASCSTEIQLNP